jgi:RimJ/RimL family protein N-acetyltransferase
VGSGRLTGPLRSPGVAELRTDRLLLRQWRDADLEPWAQLNADPEVMEHFPSVLTREESDVLAARCREHLETNGWGLWAVEVPGVTPFIGWVGLARPAFEAHFTPALEVGWRLARRWWGHGYASEAARACLGFAFGELELDEVVSFTAVSNERSQAVMRRIGMTRSPGDDFDHPNVPVGHPLRRHVLYRITRAEWEDE